MSKRRKHFDVNEALRHPDHARPVTRREFIRQGFLKGSAFALAGGAFSLFTNPHQAMAAVSGDLQALATDVGCSLGGLTGAKKVKFICFDLAGGANLAGSNVLVGQAGGQRSFLTTAGYNKLGLPGNIIPGLSSTGLAQGVAGEVLNPSSGNNFINDDLGLLFHQDSAMLYGILERFTSTNGSVDGAVIPARSDNDTANNPHNPMYGIARAGANGGVVSLIGSRNSDSGGNSMSPAMLLNPEIRPTKVDRASDVTGMVDVGNLTSILGAEDVTAVMESIARVSHKKIRLGTVNLGVTNSDVIKDLMECGYLRASDIAERFANVVVDPAQDPVIKGPGGIFSDAEFLDDEFEKTASVMKMVIDGHAGAGCITMGGYDYHTGDRQTGENRDLRAGRCIGACLEYAARKAAADPENAADQVPVMIYVYSDGSLSSNGRIDTSLPTGSNVLGGRGKGEWTGDNESTACSFFLVYNPAGSIVVNNSGLADHRQIGWFSADGSVVTSSSPAANNVNLLVNTVIANYMSLNGEISLFASRFPNHGLGDFNRYVTFGSLV